VTGMPPMIFSSETMTCTIIGVRWWMCRDSTDGMKYIQDLITLMIILAIEVIQK